MPAEAGIHSRGVVGCLFSRTRSDDAAVWIPAFAGMTFFLGCGLVRGGLFPNPDLDGQFAKRADAVDRGQARIAQVAQCFGLEHGCAVE